MDQHTFIQIYSRTVIELVYFARSIRVTRGMTPPPPEVKRPLLFIQYLPIIAFFLITWLDDPPFCF